MSKTKQPTEFYGRQAVADYLKISRMTLSRWEKVLALPKPVTRWGSDYDSRRSKAEIDKWHQDIVTALEKAKPRGAYNRPYQLKWKASESSV